MISLQFRLHFFFFFLLCLFSFAASQQPYVGLSTTNCSFADSSTSVLGYSCNGLNRTCLAYVIFRATPTLSTVSSISSLFSVDPSLLSSLNAAPTTTSSFASDQQVIVPITCSCSGDYSQANLTYTIQQNDSYFFIANNTLQGLSTCQASERHNNVSSQSLLPGMRIVVPIRCACPTAKQVDEDGVNYLMSYTVVFGDTVEIISNRFSVETSKTLEANQLSFENPGVFPFTTVLIPLQNPPSISNSPPPPPPSQSVPPPLSPDGGKSKKTWVYVLAGVLGGALVLVVIGAAIFCLVMRKSKTQEETEGNFDSFTAKKSQISVQESDPLDGLSGMVVESLKVYKIQELRSATSDFTSSSSIGGSGYIGKINGDGALIKKMEGNASEEINLLSKLNHFNIIRLSGFCFHDGDWYLVYEHASNGSLSDWIHANPRKLLLSSTQRLRIALDIATGLNYLHNFADPPYVHRDLNSSNIFLDSEFRAKIGNLGLARSTEEGEDFVLTRHVEGTRGYLAPEYLEHGFVSTKLDVYAFGVVLSEIVTGKEACELKKEIDEGNAMEDEEDRYRFWEKLLIRESFFPEGLASFVVRLVVDCLKRDHLNRPSMDEIVLSLSKILTALQSWESSF